MRYTCVLQNPYRFYCFGKKPQNESLLNGCFNIPVHKSSTRIPELIKMRRFCVLILLVVVNVLADKKIEYKKELFYTNSQMKQIKNRDGPLLPVIRKIVGGTTPMVKLSCMFVAPAKAIDESNENHEEILQQCIDSQKELQKKITTLLGVSSSEKGVVRSLMRNLSSKSDSTDSQKELQKETTTSIRVSSSEKGVVRSFMKNLSFKSDSTDTFESTGFLELEQERISLTSEAINIYLNLVINPDCQDYKNSKLMCRLKGVYRSILHPNEFIVEAEVVDDKCHLTGIDKSKNVVSVFGVDVSETHH
ncbi:uncharacterized protein LOC126847900 isoform X8 [Adelges cooleyi]|uniref:uncharacterized protein LOC126847900 isoform X6 n=1 Tax=Adelges cooleyi TaxID=133065 RepID=UPI00217FF276|nr:uncharacterized protein LOC126847900 isoform X6 [Adelges cooleyi]XP_050444278.1 uncharacterized protein LOC126847900 isoform X7 [Adelges cooleyi]XP_050444279.1 uncharacterized protein LOC126847900 isoform X8 [Adelges cooleyi]